MEIGLAILLFVCMTALLYVILSLKITRQVDLQMKEFYKTRIHQDMQEFYRDMEGYAAHFENQIQRLRTLSQRVEVAPQAPSQPLEAETMRSPPSLGEEQVLPSPVIGEGQGVGRSKKKVPLKKEPVRQAKAAKKSPPAKIQSQPKPQAKKTAAPHPPVRPTQPAKPLPVVEASPVTVRPIEDDDVTIAEELMKDLFPQDEVHLAQRPQAGFSKPTQVKVSAPAETDGEKTMSNFFSRLGRAIEPVIFGEKAAPKPVSEIARNLAPEPVKVAVPVQAKTTANFSEVLKRAEQIKAEKKAERERAEVEARAEFYAQGDAFEAAPVRQSLREEPRRNTLVVKELDQHTVNFLIDSLVKDNGYRKQALRALTENNIPLSEIARLSKIDIGELELMRQLGRF